MKSFEKKIRAHALKNAVAHDGRAQAGAVISAMFSEGLKKDDVKKYAKEISKIVADINKLSLEQQEKEFSTLKDVVSEREVREGLEELPNVRKTGVMMRFAPSPSGPLHIGHAATACISFLYVKKYGGKFYVRIEDTNPGNIYPKAYDMIADESKWLFDGIAKIQIQSDNMKKYYEYADKLIRKKAAYVCTCTSEQFKEFVDNQKECPCRNLSVDDNIIRWKKMLDKTKKGFGEGDAVLRFKSENGMQNKNPAMRDFPLARINLTKHARQGNKYRVWPLMNFAVSVDDIEDKMTHIIRAKDHRDNAERQRMIFKALGKEKQFPWTAFLGRYKFTDMELSSSQMRKDIDAGKFRGWDDPRLPTIASLRKQGYKPQAFWKFAERVGLSESDKVMDKKEYFNLLNAFNRG
ncbi:MAG: glutamate--tRNA ligase family protein [Nanoarchaeota archaeon]